MYPNLYYAFKDLFGVDWKFLRFINSFGFFVAIAFSAAFIILSKELRRKEAQGLLQYKEEIITVGNPASLGELLTNFILGFLLGYKIVGLFFSDSSRFSNPQDFIFSFAGSWPAGLLLGFIFSGLKWWEKNKHKLAEPEQRKIRIWPHDRVGDITIFAAIFGFLGAKIFNSLENWNEFVKSPIESLLSFSGLTFYGGLICAALAIWYYARKRNISFWHLNDAAAPALMIAYAIGRIGCHVSGDGDWGIINSAYFSTPDQKVVNVKPDFYNIIVTKNAELYISQFGSLNVPHRYVKAPSFLPDWLFAYPYAHNVINEGLKIPDCNQQYCSYLPLPVFPTSFYETIICLILFFVIWSLRKKFTVPGTLFGFYLVLNGIERFFIEKIRVNTKYDILGFHPTQAEIISFLLVLSGILLYITLIQRNKRLEAIQKKTRDS
ncbi:MAG TPA: prolipoprotein diacylglyceryl transferase family protein [Puia sp.]|nr:prolipoprotein diacylglyceryl transferase family protein [Puia sp.]